MGGSTAVQPEPFILVQLEACVVCPEILGFETSQSKTFRAWTWWPFNPLGGEMYVERSAHALLAVTSSVLRDAFARASLQVDRLRP